MPSKVKIEIDGKNKGAIKSINGVKTSLLGMQKQTTRLSQRMDASFTKMGGIIGGLKSKLTLMGLAAITGFGFMIKSAIDAAESLEKMSQRVGLSVEFLSTLRHATELAGTEITVMEKALQRMSRTLFDANRGLLTAKIPFDELGVAVADSMGQLRSGEVVLLEVADKFAKMEDGTLKTALALQIFGRAGADLIPLLNAGAEGIREMQEEARALGLEISTNTAKQAALFKDNMLALERSFVGVANVAAVQLLPTLINITEALKTGTGETERFKQAFGFLANTFKVFVTVASFALTNFMTIWTTVIGLIKAGGQSLSLEFLEAGKTLSDTLDNIGTNYSNFTNFVNTLWSDLADNTGILFKGAAQGFLFVGKAGEDAANSLGLFRGELELITVTAQSTAREIRALGLEASNLLAPSEPVDLTVFQANNEMIKAGITDITDFELAQFSVRMLAGVNFYGNMADAALGFYQASGQASREWFTVYKAFAIAQTAISTYEGAVAAYKAMAGIPVVGPFLGVAAAAALTAYGLGNIARISAMTPGGGFGGGVPSSTPSLPGNIINNTSTSTRNIDFNVTVISQGNIDDLDAFARKLIDSLRRAEADGA